MSSTALNNIKGIISILHTYPEAKRILNIEDLVKPDDVERNHREWMRLISKYSEIDRKFFKPSWVYLNTRSYDYFIDIDDPHYGIFAICFMSREPRQWLRTKMFDNINDLLNNIEDNEFLENRMIEHKMEYIDETSRLYEANKKEEKRKRRQDQKPK